MLQRNSRSNIVSKPIQHAPVISRGRHRRPNKDQGDRKRSLGLLGDY
jgi:hypothetical protein